MTLVQIFTAIANAIRAKKGTSGTITASNFPTEIAGIQTGHLDNTEYQDANDTVDDILENTTVPSGTISITANGEYDVTNYVEANVNISLNNYFNATISSGSSSSSGVNQMIKTIPSTTAIRGTSMTHMFRNCSGLISIPQLDTSNITKMGFAFAGCTILQNIPVLDTSQVQSMAYMFQSCTRLSDESLNNILQMCINATSYTEEKTLSALGFYSSYFPESRIQALSNYQAFLDAGWTTGY